MSGKRVFGAAHIRRHLLGVVRQADVEAILGPPRHRYFLEGFFGWSDRQRRLFWKEEERLALEIVRGGGPRFGRSLLNSVSEGEMAMITKHASFAEARGQVRAALAAMGWGRPEAYIDCWAKSDDTTPFGAWGPIQKGYWHLIETFRWVDIGSPEGR
jgi:hypothetical protein